MREIQEPEILLEGVLATLRAAKVPAVVYDPFYHIVAVNRLALALHPVAEIDDSLRTPQRNVHFLHSVLEPQSPVRRDMHTIWDQFLRLNVHQFRVMTLRYRHTAYFQELFDDLLRYEDFQDAWLATQFNDADYDTQLRRYCYHHPHYGMLEYATTMESILTSLGKLYLSLLTPLDEYTWIIFNNLMQTVDPAAVPLTPWPHAALAAAYHS